MYILSHLTTCISIPLLYLERIYENITTLDYTNYAVIVTQHHSLKHHILSE